MKIEKKKSRGRPAANTRSSASDKSNQGGNDAISLINQLMDQTYPPTQCPSCGHQGHTRTETEAHYRQHHKGLLGYVCMDKACQQGFSSRPGLQYHLRSSHSFTRVKDAITITMIKSKGMRPAIKLDDDLEQKLDLHYNALICPSCKAQFQKKTQTLVHINTAHYKEKLFECFVDDCQHENGFASLQALVYHLSKHNTSTLQ